MQNAIISFTHTNYCIRSAGTEKFVRSMSQIVQKQGVAHLNFFSFYDDGNRMKKKMVGVNYNDKFQGVYEYNRVYEIICFFSKKYHLKFITIQLQHLLNHDLEDIAYLINKMKVNVHLYIHDYYLVCDHLKLINTKDSFCGISRPSREKCSDCGYYCDAAKHFEKINHFIRTVNESISFVITPSEYVTQNIRSAFPEFAEKLVTRPHLSLSGNYYKTRTNTKIRIAFAGGQFKEKGYLVWERIVNHLASQGNCDYEFYYFGIGNKVMDCVTNVYVSTAEQGEKAMSDAIKKYNIDCALLWPLLPETYSYVYYELLTNGVYCLTNENSGNIANEVRNCQNGRVFCEEKDCIEWLSHFPEVKRALQEYVNNHRIPSAYTNNEELNYLISANNVFSFEGNTIQAKKDMVFTLMYRLKYRKYL